MPDVLSWLGDLPQPVMLLTAATLIIIEAGLLVGVVLPGASVVLALGVLAHAGMTDPLLAAAAAAAAAAGTQLAYLRGRQHGLRTPARLRRSRQRASRLLRRTGPVALCITQWVVVLRTLTPRLAGSDAIRYRRFAAASVPAGAVWGVALVALGYLAGAAYESLSRWFGFGAAAVLAVLLSLGWILRRHVSATQSGGWRWVGAQDAVQDAVPVGAVAPLRPTDDALALETGHFQRPLLGDTSDIGVGLDSIGRGVAEQRLDQPRLGAGPDALAAVLRPQPDTHHRDARGVDGRPLCRY